MNSGSPMEYPEAKDHCLRLAEHASKGAPILLDEEDAERIRAVVAWAQEADETIKMLSNQLADKREIIRRLTS